MMHKAVLMVMLVGAARLDAQARAENRNGRLFLTNEAPVALTADRNPTGA